MTRCLLSGNYEVHCRVFVSVRINFEKHFEQYRDQVTTKLSLRILHELGTSGIEGDRFTGDRSRLGKRNIKGRKE